jgi:hypothetical protein
LYLEIRCSKAFRYKADIDDELSKGGDSEIRIDKQKSNQEGVKYITISSVDQWAEKKYGISIMDDYVQYLSPDSTRAQSIAQDKDEDLDIKDGLKRREAESFLTTFAFLIDALLKETSNDKSIKFGEDTGHH